MESDRISQTLAARIVSAQPVISPEIFNYHPRETPLRSLLLFCTPLRRSWNVARRSKGPQRNMAVEISPCMYHVRVFEWNLQWDDNLCPTTSASPPRRLGWRAAPAGGKGKGIGDLRRRSGIRKKNAPWFPLKNTGRQTANISGDTMLLAPLSLPETNTVIVFDENAPLVDFSEIYIFWSLYVFQKWFLINVSILISDSEDRIIVFLFDLIINIGLRKDWS